MRTKKCSVVRYIQHIGLWIIFLNTALPFAYSQEQHLQWHTIGHLKSARSHCQIAAISPYQVIVVGGYTTEQQKNKQILVPTTSCEIIDVQTRSIHQAISTLEPHSEATLVQKGDSDIVLVSGVGKNHLLTKTCEQYDRLYKSWRIIGSLVIARRKAMATFVNNEEILIVGGFNQNNQPIAETEILNIRTNKSRVVAQFPHPVALGVCAVSVVLSYGKAIVIAGIGAGGMPQNFIYEFDKKRSVWEKRGTYMASISSPQAIRLFDDRLLISGGEGNPARQGTIAVSDFIAIESYWGFKKLASMLTTRKNYAIAQWNTDSLLVIGGSHLLQETYFSTEWVHIPTQKCYPAPALNEARHSAIAITLPMFDGSDRQYISRIIVVAGINKEGNILSSIEVLEERVSTLPTQGNQKNTLSYNFVLAAPSALLLLILFLLLLALSLLYLVRALQKQADIQQEQHRVMHEKERLRTQITTLRLQTLHLQMKPHFVYNSLAAIESLILEKKTEMASHYIRVVAKLFRMVLDHSDNSTVSVKETIEFLKVYIALEQLRMSHNFEYAIDYTLSPQQIHLHIPNILIQPYIENAIKYGLGLLQDFNAQNPLQSRKGQLHIILSYINQDGQEYIVCSVEDNGVGRTRAKAIYSSRTSLQGLSRSTRINEERLLLLSNLNIDKIHVQYDDLTDIHGIAIGTRVTLHIPIITRSHLEEAI